MKPCGGAGPLYAALEFLTWCRHQQGTGHERVNFYNNIKSWVSVNGQLSHWFKMQRGCRQAEPISPDLFILCVDILTIMIRQNKTIKGIQVNDTENTISQYADDTELFFRRRQKLIWRSYSNNWIWQRKSLDYFWTQGKQMQYGWAARLTRQSDIRLICTWSGIYKDVRFLWSGWQMIWWTVNILASKKGG